MTHSTYVAMTTDIVAAYVSKNQIAANELRNLIATTYVALSRLSDSSGPAVPETRQKPAVPLKKSILPDAIICLEDGRRLKMLKRYLRTNYDMSPDEYRAKWNLPEDYPMTAPDYATHRSNLAKSAGLGQKGGRGRKNGE